MPSQVHSQVHPGADGRGVSLATPSFPLPEKVPKRTAPGCQSTSCSDAVDLGQPLDPRPHLLFRVPAEACDRPLLPSASGRYFFVKKKNAAATEIAMKANAKSTPDANMSSGDCQARPPPQTRTSFRVRMIKRRQAALQRRARVGRNMLTTESVTKVWDPGHR